MFNDYRKLHHAPVTGVHVKIRYGKTYTKRVEYNSKLLTVGNGEYLTTKGEGKDIV